MAPIYRQIPVSCPATKKEFENEAVKSVFGADLLTQMISLPKMCRISPVGTIFLTIGALITYLSTDTAVKYPIDTIINGTFGIMVMLVGKYIMWNKHIPAYVHARTFLLKHGYHSNFIKFYFNSWCGINIIKLASKETGHFKEYKNQYQMEGCKWNEIGRGGHGEVL